MDGAGSGAVTGYWLGFPKRSSLTSWDPLLLGHLIPRARLSPRIRLPWLNGLKFRPRSLGPHLLRRLLWIQEMEETWDTHWRWNQALTKSSSSLKNGQRLKQWRGCHGVGEQAWKA